MSSSPSELTAAASGGPVYLTKNGRCIRESTIELVWWGSSWIRALFAHFRLRRITCGASSVGLLCCHFRAWPWSVMPRASPLAVSKGSFCTIHRLQAESDHHKHEQHFNTETFVMCSFAFPRPWVLFIVDTSDEEMNIFYFVFKTLMRKTEQNHLIQRCGTLSLASIQLMQWHIDQYHKQSHKTLSMQPNVDQKKKHQVLQKQFEEMS